MSNLSIPSRTFCAALAVAALGLAILSPAGDAAPGKPRGSGCQKDALCLWAKPNYTGKKVVITSHGVSNQIAKQLNNRASSVKNRFGKTTFVYDKRGGEGELRCFGGDANIEDLAGSYVFDNRATSSRLPKDPGACV